MVALRLDSVSVIPFTNDIHYNFPLKTLTNYHTIRWNFYNIRQLPKLWKYHFGQSGRHFSVKKCLRIQRANPIDSV